MSVVSNRAIVMWPLLAALAPLSLFLQLCVSGCAVGPSYRTPATALESFHSVGALEARPASAPAPALEVWWDGFNDPLLSRIVQRARDQNLDLAAALARVQQARAAAREAGAQLLPTLNVTTSVFWGSMACTLIGGTAAGTVLTLLFLPALYAIWFRVKKPDNAAAPQSLALPRRTACA